MKLIDKENGRSLVEVKEGDDDCKKHEYASKATAGTALGLSIGALGWNLLRGNGGLFGSNLFGGGAPNIAIARSGSDSGNGVSANEQYIERKECEDMLATTKAMYDLYIIGQNNRFTDSAANDAAHFGLYKSMRDGFDVINANANAANFSLYKYSRDSKDELASQLNDLKVELAVLKATRPYQDALLQCDIRSVAEHADFNLWRRTCRMIEGEVVLPSTPTVTGYPSQRCCLNQSTPSTPTA